MCDDSVIGEEVQVEIEVQDGVAEIKIPEEVFEDAVPLWESFLVGSIHSTVNRSWNSPGSASKIDV